MLTAMKWLRTELLQSAPFHSSERLLNKYLLILKTRGKKEAIRFCKESRNSIYRYLSSIESIKKEIRSLSPVGLPKDLRFLKYKNELTYPEIRLVLSSLYISRGLELPPVANVQSITSAPTHRAPEDIGKYVGDFWDALGYRVKHANPKIVFWRKFHLSTKNGPNGQALWSAIADLATLPPSLMESIKVVGGKKLYSLMELLRRYLYVFMPFFGVESKRFRKVSSISSQEGKTREVAILDYWSQTSLRGLHRFLFGCLKKIPQDCTFNQGSFHDKLNQENGEMFYSVDLTAATDRFPISLISLVLKGRFTDDYVNHWHNIMVGYPFWTRLSNNSVEPINYAVGNPMGAYSSWNSFALAHHYVMYSCCRDLGINWSNAPYVLLGDDIVIKHGALAKKYMDVISSLGVEFSSQKTHISPFMYEFAKRVIHSGVEVTPFPISALWSSRKEPSLILNSITNEQNKGWSFPNGIPAVSSELYRYLGFCATFVAKKRKIFFLSHQVMMALSGRIKALSAVKLIAAEYYPELLSKGLRKQTGMSLAGHSGLWFLTILNDSLRSSASSKPGDKPLGLIAEQLVCLITGRDDTIIDAFDLIQAIPVLQIHGQVEEAYMTVVKGDLSSFAAAMRQDWKSVLRALTIPISDQVYISRNQELMVHASFTLAKALRIRIEKLLANPEDVELTLLPEKAFKLKI